MAYTADYTESDLSNSVIDTIVAAIIVVGQFVTIIVLIFLYNWMKKRV